MDNTRSEELDEIARVETNIIHEDIKRGCSKTAREKQETEVAENSRPGLLFVVKLLCEKQITATKLWHMRAECATEN